MLKATNMEDLNEMLEEACVLLEEMIEEEDDTSGRNIELMYVVPQACSKVFVNMKDSNYNRYKGFVDLSKFESYQRILAWTGYDFYMCRIYENRACWGLPGECRYTYSISAMDIYDLFVEQGGKRS